MASSTYSVDDEFGNQITTGLPRYSDALQCARKYLSAHDDAPEVLIYTDDESWTLPRTEVLS